MLVAVTQAFGLLAAGVMYAGGRGVEKDESKAAHWWAAAAAQGIALAQFNLGTCGLSNSLYCVQINTRYCDRRTDVPKRARRAQRRIKSRKVVGGSCCAGSCFSAIQDWSPSPFPQLIPYSSDFSMPVAGMMYAEGRGVVKNEGKAVKWWEAAAAVEGDAEVQFNLGTSSLSRWVDSSFRDVL